jgi:hypothetical protein
MEIMAEKFPGAFSGYKLEVIVVCLVKIALLTVFILLK